MGCDNSKEEEEDFRLLALFVARVRNSGATRELLGSMPADKRLGFVRELGFAEDEAKKVVAQWEKLGGEIDAQAAKQAGVDIRWDLTIPQLDDEQGKKDRVAEVQARRPDYAFSYPTGGAHRLPPHPSSVAKAEKVGAEHKVTMFIEHEKTKLSLNFNHALDMVSNIFVDEDPFKDWADLYRTATVPLVTPLWRSDEEFARQKLNGVNPNLIRAVSLSTVLAKVPLSNQLVENVLPKGTTLETLDAEHRLLWCDYEELDGLPAPADAFLSAPIAVFYIDARKKLMPLAIQLCQVAGPSAPIFVPDPAKTHPGAWLAARIHCQVADAHLHEITSHYLATHAIPEIIYTSMMRQLSVQHPVSELLRPNFWFTVTWQSAARQDLIGPDGHMQRLMACGYDGMVALLGKAFEQWNWPRYDLPARLKKRGLDDSSKLPDYYYRDDGVRLYAIIERFVSDLIKDFYPDEGLLRQDNELQAWGVEMAQLGLRGLPLNDANQFATTKDLAAFLTQLIFAATAGHSMVNNGQWDYFGYIPNCPGRFRLRPPTDPMAPISDKDIAAALPGFQDSCDQIAIVKALSTKPTKRIGEYQASFMAGRPNVLPFVRTYQANLAALSKEIQGRNTKLAVPYPYLDPQNISNCIDT